MKRGPLLRERHVSSVLVDTPRYLAAAGVSRRLWFGIKLILSSSGLVISSEDDRVKHMSNHLSGLFGNARLIYLSQKNE